ncbi:MAG: hypothetical protein KGH54_03405 [Candidatus Micrarchaeota archaeon]|nr:hypothetical protein [Candidatus Micrarchaeota archaeon]
MPDFSSKEKLAIGLALGIVALSAISIGTFIVTGGSAIFYIVAVIAVALGFYINYYLSKTEQEQPARKAKK